MSPLPSWRGVPVPSSSVESHVAVPAQNLLRIYDCADPSLEADHWVKGHRAELERELHAHGAVLLRGFRADRATFARVADQISPFGVERNLFASSELPPSVTLPQHHEMMFSLCWPMKVLLFAERPAPSGGETALCSGRWATHRLPARILREFDCRGGITYVRNFRPDLPFKSLEDTFRTRDRDHIEALCRRDAIDVEWLSPTWLQTRQTRPAFRIHPVTGDRIFVASPHLWHRAAWIRQLGRDQDAMDATYGDGTSIDPSVIDELLAFFEAEKHAVAWRTRDIMILDNLLVSRGRNAFEGDRLTIATLREPYAAAT